MLISYCLISYANRATCIYKITWRLDFILKIIIELSTSKRLSPRAGEILFLNCKNFFYFSEEQAELKEQPGLWKQIRGEILNALEIKICQTLNKDCDLDDNEFIDKIDAFFIHNTCHSETLQTSESIKCDKSDKSDKINEKPSKTVFIIDDNNYLSSMRHEFYQENEHYFFIDYFEINIQFLIFAILFIFYYDCQNFSEILGLNSCFRLMYHVQCVSLVF